MRKRNEQSGKESADLNAAMTIAFPTKEQITRLSELGMRAQELETLWLELSEAKERVQSEIAAL